MIMLLLFILCFNILIIYGYSCFCIVLLFLNVLKLGENDIILKLFFFSENVFFLVCILLILIVCLFIDDVSFEVLGFLYVWL